MQAWRASCTRRTGSRIEGYASIYGNNIVIIGDLCGARDAQRGGKQAVGGVPGTRTTWGELCMLGKMVGWVYTLNEAGAEGTNTRVTMEESSIFPKRAPYGTPLPTGKQSHRRNTWAQSVRVGSARANALPVGLCCRPRDLKKKNCLIIRNAIVMHHKCISSTSVPLALRSHRHHGPIRRLSMPWGLPRALL